MYERTLKRTALQMGALALALTTVCALLVTLGRLAAPGGGTPVPSAADAVRQPVKPLRRVRIRAVGDVIIHQRQLDFALQPDGSYDFHPQFARISDALADADYTIANLETTVGRRDNKAYSGFPMFNTPESVLEALADAGVDFLTLANNHILDRQFDGMLLTVDNVERYGFDHGGANRSLEEKDTPVVVDAGGMRLGMLCYTEMTNGMKKNDRGLARQYGVNYLMDADIEADVRRLRSAGAEVIVALPHWGVEYSRKPQQSAEAMARRMVAAGVDVVLGSHPHVVQPVGFIEAQDEAGRTRRGLVAYSLGNFLSNQGKQYTDSGILLDFTLQEKEGGGFDVCDVRVLPTFCWRQDDVFQTLPALQYYDAPPEGMDKGLWQRLRDSVDALGEMTGALPLIGE